MTNKYSITGMSCDGCRSHVEKALNGVSGVVKATVDLTKKEAVVESEEEISLDKLTSSLSGTTYGIYPSGELPNEDSGKKKVHV